MRELFLRRSGDGAWASSMDGQVHLVSLGPLQADRANCSTHCTEEDCSWLLVLVTPIAVIRDNFVKRDIAILIEVGNRIVQ